MDARAAEDTELTADDLRHMHPDDEVIIHWKESGHTNAQQTELRERFVFPRFLLDDIHCKDFSWLRLMLYAERRTGLALVTRVGNFYVHPTAGNANVDKKPFFRALHSGTAEDIVANIGDYVAWWLPVALCERWDENRARVIAQRDIIAADSTFEQFLPLGKCPIEQMPRHSGMQVNEYLAEGEDFLYNKQSLRPRHREMTFQLLTAGTDFVTQVLGE